MKKTVLLAGAATIVLALAVPAGIWVFMGDDDQLVIEQVEDHGTGGLTGEGPVLGDMGSQESGSQTPVLADEGPVSDAASSQMLVAPVSPVEDLSEQVPFGVASAQPELVSPVQDPVSPPLMESDEEVVMPMPAPVGGDIIEEGEGVESVESVLSSPLASTMVGGEGTETLPGMDNASDDILSDLNEGFQQGLASAPVMEPMMEPSQSEVLVPEESMPVEEMPEETVLEGPSAEELEKRAFASVLPVVLSLSDAYAPMIDSAGRSGDEVRLKEIRSELAMEIREAVEGMPNLTFEQYLVYAQRLVDDPAFYDEVMSYQ